MATFTVDTDGTSGTYSTLSAAVAALPNPFTSNNTITLAASTGVADTTAVTLDINTTTNYRLYINGSANYLLSLADTARLYVGPTNASSYQNITLKSIRLARSSMAANYGPLFDCYNTVFRQGTIIVDGCDFLGFNTGNTYRDRMISIGGNASFTTKVVFVNNTFTSRSTVASTANTVFYAASNAPVYFYNNTVKAYKFLYTAASAFLATNNIFKTTVASDAISTSSNYNAFAGNFDGGGANDTKNQTFTFTNEASFDYTLASNDTGAINKGTDLSANANYSFTNDKADNTRSGTWDLGAYEYIPATVTGTLANAQKKQTTAIAGTMSMTGTLSDAQKKQTTAINGTMSMAGTASVAQKKQTTAITGTMSMTGTSAIAQKKQTTNISSVTVPVTGIISIGQKKQTTAITGTMTISGSSAVAQKKQSDSITATMSMTGTISAAQKKQVAAINETMFEPVNIVLDAVSVSGFTLEAISNSTITLTFQGDLP